MGSKTQILRKVFCTRCWSLSGAVFAWRPYSSDAITRPRRAVLYVPTPDQKKTRKIPTLNVDTVVFDFEDGVALNQKDVARHLIQDTLGTCRAPNTEHVVRVNGSDSGLLDADLKAVFGGNPSPSKLPDALMLPKVENTEHLQQLELSLLPYCSSLPSPLPLFAIIESPMALLNLRTICEFGIYQARMFKLCALVFGSDDFIALLGGTRTAGATELIYARQSVVTHAKAFGMDAIDMVDIEYKNLDNLKCQALEGARMGYTGKQVIHPNQVPVVQGAFSPSEDQVRWARGLITAFEENQKAGKGAFEYDGKMIDRPLLLQARNIISCYDTTSK
eukprot:Em0023g47a